MADDLKEVNPSDLPPAVRAAAAAAMGGKTPTWWERNILPLRPAAEEAFSFMSGAPMADASGKIQPTGIEKFLGSQVIAPTATDEALNALMMMMPEGEALEGLPPPIRALLSSRLRRIGTVGAAGAGIGAATGEGAGAGFKKGAVGQVGGEAISTIGRRVLEGNEATRYATNLGKTIRARFPLLDSALQRMGKTLNSASDFLVFKGGQDSQAMKEASKILGEAKDQVKIVVGNQPILTTRPVLTPKGAILRPSQAWVNLLRDNMTEARELKIGESATFEQVDQLISRARVKAYRLSSGVGKDSALGARIRRNSDAALDALAARLNGHAAGIGDLYRAAQGDWAEANQLSKMLSEKGVIEGNKIVPSKLQELGMESGQAGYYTELERTPAGREVSKKIYRGAPATATDQPRAGLSIYGGGEILPIHIRRHIHPFGTKRVGREAVQLYHGIPAIVAKALAESGTPGFF